MDRTGKLAALIVLLMTIQAAHTAVSSPSPSSIEPDARPTVIAYIDTGINPYHEAFRDPARTGDPGERIAGYPDDALPFKITLDAASYDEALQQDKTRWEAFQSGQLYHLPGTRIIGAITFSDPDPGRLGVLDAHGHGTKIADAGFGNTRGADPEAWIVVVRGPMHPAMMWVAAQPWIDIVSISTESPMHLNPVGSPNYGQWDKHRINSALVGGYEMSQEGRMVVNGAGNGPFADSGVNLLDPYMAPWVFRVGGTEEIDYYDRTILCETCSRPFDVAAVWRGTWAAIDTLDGAEPAAGTSYAAPQVAAYAGRLIREARIQLDDHEGFRDGAYAIAAPRAVLPAEGPLSDGRFELDELKELMRDAADPLPFWHVWYQKGQEIPPELAYWYRGYGSFNESTYQYAREVLLGAEPWPEDRPWDDYWHSVVDETMTRYWEPWVCRGQRPPAAWPSCPLGVEEPQGLIEQIRSMPALA